MKPKFKFDKRKKFKVEKATLNSKSIKPDTKVVVAGWGANKVRKPTRFLLKIS